ncbi:hypothetical protein [Bartonella tribocorum]|uniref:hypothetical protein n=1 Tax=Bartonella tribocorum TaxID=85701 RepID=UPI0015DFFB2E|nr:hypothetical protein [Bartonella tribocorum]
MKAPLHLQHEKKKFNKIFNKVIVKTEPISIELFAMQIVVSPLLGNPRQTIPELEKAL